MISDTKKCPGFERNDEMGIFARHTFSRGMIINDIKAWFHNVSSKWQPVVRIVHLFPSHGVVSISPGHQELHLSPTAPFKFIQPKGGQKICKGSPGGQPPSEVKSAFFAAM